MLRIYCGDKPLHDEEYSEEFGKDCYVWGISITKTVNKPDSLEFKIHDSHPYSNDVYTNCEEITVFKYESKQEPNNGEYIFYGRVLSTSISLNGERSIKCESELGYLYDSFPSPFLFENIRNSAGVEHILSEHNSQVSRSADNSKIDKRIYLKPSNNNFDRPYLKEYDADNNGIVLASDARLILIDKERIEHFSPTGSDDPSEDVYGYNAAERRDALADIILAEASSQPYDKSFYSWSGNGSESSLEILLRQMCDQFGGFLKISHENGRRYLSYSQINDANEPSDQNAFKISVKENLLDISYEKSAEEHATQILPLGADITTTDALNAQALENRTWLVFGDASAVSKITASNTVNVEYGSIQDSDIASLESGKVARFAPDDYTGVLSKDEQTRIQLNAYTSSGKSYVNLLAEASGMKVISMAEETETLFKHSGHAIDNGRKQSWRADGHITSNGDKSVLERLFDIFGPARLLGPTIDTAQQVVGPDGVTRYIITDAATGMILEHDCDENWDGEYTGLRKFDFVTLHLGLWDWLNADSILGNNESGIKHSAYANPVGSDAGADSLHIFTSSTAIDDFYEGNRYFQNPVDPKFYSYFDDDGNRVEFKKTLYWQIRYLCMYLKACFPESHIIIFSSFGSKRSKDDGGTGEKNAVGQYGWYPNSANRESASYRTRERFYSESEKETWMKRDTEQKGEWSRCAPPSETPGGIMNQYLEVDGQWYEKVHLYGDYTKSSKTNYKITQEGKNPDRWDSETLYGNDYRAFSKVSIKNGDDSTENLAYLTEWNTINGTVKGILASDSEATEDYAIANVDNSPSIIRNPYETLQENSYSISDLNSAISSICDELDIVYVDSENATGISVNNFGELTQDSESDVVYHADVIPYDNLGNMGTKSGRYGEFFYGGRYLNDKGHVLMAKAVRDAMLECLRSDGTIESPERLTLDSVQYEYFMPILINVADDVADRALSSDIFRVVRIVSTGKVVKIDGIYDKVFDSENPQETRLKFKSPYSASSPYTDDGGYGEYDLIDEYGDYNNKAFEILDMSISPDNFVLNQNITHKMFPVAPGDPVVLSQTFDDISDPKELFYAAAEYLYNNYSQSVISITVSAIDINIVSPINDETGGRKSPKEGDIAIVNAPKYGLHNSWFVIDSITETDNPADQKITLKSSGGSYYEGEPLAANPYGSAKNKMVDVFSKFSDLYGSIFKINGGK